jgi:hypothetical protein
MSVSSGEYIFCNVTALVPPAGTEIEEVVVDIKLLFLVFIR